MGAPKPGELGPQLGAWGNGSPKSRERTPKPGELGGWEPRKQGSLRGGSPQTGRLKQVAGCLVPPLGVEAPKPGE